MQGVQRYWDPLEKPQGDSSWTKIKLKNRIWMHMNVYCGHPHYQSLLHKGGFLLCFIIYIFLDYGEFYSVEQCRSLWRVVCGKVLRKQHPGFSSFKPPLPGSTIGNILTIQVPSMPPK